VQAELSLAMASGSSKGHLTNHKPFKVNHGLSGNSHDQFKFDLQLLLQRDSLSETWNQLMRNGALMDLMSNSITSNKGAGCLNTAFPCACCDGDCDVKCKGLPKTTTSIVQVDNLTKILNSWTWGQDQCKSMIYSYLVPVPN
jgi:hypothetical protein